MSTKASEDKKRIPNFTTCEKEHLIRIIYAKYGKILEDKQTNKVSMEEKARTWQKIECEFNSTAPIECYRNQEQLKRMYENKKKELRKKIAEQKKETFTTGGGSPPPDLKLNDIEQTILQIINEKTVYGFNSAFDSDILKEPEEGLFNKKTKYDMDPSAFVPDKETVKIYEFHPSEKDNIWDAIEMENSEQSDIDQSSTSNTDKYKRCPPFNMGQPISEKLKLPHIMEPQKKKLALDVEFDLPLAPNSTPKSCIKTPQSGEKNKKPDLELNLTSTLRSTPKSLQTGEKRSRNIMKSEIRSNRRRPLGQIRALSSSDVSEKYNVLLDRRLVLVEKQIEEKVQTINFSAEEHKLKIKNLKQQEENLLFEKEEKALKTNLLKLEFQCKKSMLTSDN